MKLLAALPGVTVIQRGVLERGPRLDLDGRLDRARRARGSTSVRVTWRGAPSVAGPPMLSATTAAIAATPAAAGAIEGIGQATSSRVRPVARAALDSALAR